MKKKRWIILIVFIVLIGLGIGWCFWAQNNCKCKPKPCPMDFRCTAEIQCTESILCFNRYDWHFFGRHIDKNIVECDEETGCCEIKCSSMENCESYESCPRQTYYHRWKKVFGIYFTL